jgi:phosphatidate cytidylyltransferase
VLRTRVLSAAILGPLVIFLAYLGGIPWLVGVTVAGILAWREMVRLLERSQFTLDRSLGLVFVISAITEGFVYSSGLITDSLLRPLLAGLIIFSLIWALYIKSEHPIADWGATVASALYLGFLLSHFVSMRELGSDGTFQWLTIPTSRSSGFWWVLLTAGLSWIADSMAYFVGTAWGKHKLWPRISPKKTWEGLAGGTVAVLIAAPLLGWWFLRLNPMLGLLLGVMVAALDPFGDFAVSLFKRIARSKDTSRLIPGHGGVLDRMDSLLFTFPVVYYFARLIIGA